MKTSMIGKISKQFLVESFARNDKKLKNYILQEISYDHAISCAFFNKCLTPVNENAVKDFTDSVTDSLRSQDEFFYKKN